MARSKSARYLEWNVATMGMFCSRAIFSASLPDENGLWACTSEKPTLPIRERKGRSTRGKPMR